MTDVDRIAREKDVETLRRMALLLIKENERLVAKVSELHQKLLKAEGKAAEQLRLEIASLEKELAQRSGQLLGHVSEKRSKSAGDGATGGKPPQKGHGPREQPKLAIEDVVHDLDEADKTCRACGGGLEEWTGQFEESEEVDVIERRFVLRRHKRKKYRCRCGGCVETAPMPKRLLGGGRYAAGFAIAVAIGKYLDHLPLERQVRQMARAGLECDSQTLFDQCWALCNLLRPAYARLGELQRAQKHPFQGHHRTRPSRSTRAVATRRWTEARGA